MDRSPFNPDQQIHHIDSKIVVALERISAAFRVLLWNESKETSLSPIQIQILIFLLFHTHEKSKPSYLAREFNITKATVSDSVKVLMQKQLVQKEADQTDSRSFGLKLTREGKRMAQQLASFSGAIEAPISKLTKEQKEAMLGALLMMIHQLNQQGIITIQRMCLTCSHYAHTGSQHYCSLLQTKLKDTELRLDCPEHALAI